MSECVNPYNFIRPGKPAVKAEPRGHDKFEGLSGKITCSLKLITPVFIPDPEKRKEIEDGENKGHKILEFFRVNNKPVIPPTELKGMIRSVVEAASNSCFSVFDGGRLGKRLEPRDKGYRRRIAGRIINIPSPNRDESVVEMEDIKVSDDVAKKYKFWNNITVNGKEVYVNRNAIDGRKITNTEDLSESFQEGYTVGYLKTSDEFGSKKFERVFVEKTNPRIFGFPYTIYQDFRVANKNSKYDKTKDLKSGDTVWLRVKEDKVEEIGFAQIYRKSFTYSLQEKLEKWSREFSPCNNRNRLCPACRMFGMVAEGENKGGVAGNISFSMAEPLDSSWDLRSNQLLKILSLPKPTFHPFYLLDGDYFNLQSKLRGRKFYWHQPFDELNGLKRYTTTREELKGKNQNLGLTSSVELLLLPAEFIFTVDFDNLDEYELGLLLWSLELEDGMAHKLGMGKPLGLGSVGINIQKLEIIDREKRYKEIFSSGISDKTSEKHTYIDAFKKGLEKENGNKFDEIPNISDLKKIMNLQNPPQGNVRYPGDFKWFTNNKNQPLPTIDETVNKTKSLTGCTS